jgi:hypothetical protein
MSYRDSQAVDLQRKTNSFDQWNPTLKAHNIPTPAFIDNEPLDNQRKRFMEKVRPFVSDDLQKVRTDDIFGSALDHLEKRFIESASQEALRPTRVPDGTLKEVVSYDQSGRPMYSYFGSPRSWMDAFAAPKKRLVGINAPLNWTKV